MEQEVYKSKFTKDQKINLVIAISTFILTIIAFIGLIFALANFKIINSVFIILIIFIGIFIIGLMIVRWVKK